MIEQQFFSSARLPLITRGGFMTKLKIAALIAGASLTIFAAACATAVVNDNANKPANMAPPVNTSKPANLAPPANSNMKMPANSNMKMPPPKPSATKKP
jgi:hypothetical protein